MSGGIAQHKRTIISGTEVRARRASKTEDRIQESNSRQRNGNREAEKSSEKIGLSNVNSCNLYYLRHTMMDLNVIFLQLTTKSFSTTSQTELENRLHALTESLIQKQTMLEALSTEKNSLGLQLERLEVGFSGNSLTYLVSKRGNI